MTTRTRNLKIDLDKFENWLRERGVDILTPTNQYELLRFKGNKIGVLYNTGRTSGKYMNGAITSFLNTDLWKDAPTSTPKLNQTKKHRLRSRLAKRDGQKCFYCREPLGDDRTIEHLISLTNGGRNVETNMVLSHGQCNNNMRGKSLVEKIQFAIDVNVLEERKRKITLKRSLLKEVFIKFMNSEIILGMTLWKSKNSAKK